MRNKLKVSKEDALICYKGFKQKDGKLTCLDMEYTPGGIHVAPSPVKLCQNGFHCCRTLEEVDNHYSIHESQHVFYKVKVWGEIEEDEGGVPKLAAQYLEIVEKVNDTEMFFTKLKDKLKTVDKILEDNPNLIIGGSLALILRGLIPYRYINDLDFVLPYFGGFKEAEVNGDTKYHDQADSVKMRLDGYEFDLFINPYETYDIIELPDGRKYKVVNPIQTFLAKLKYGLNGNVKHLKDLSDFIETVLGKPEKEKDSYSKWNLVEVDDMIGKDRYDLKLRERRGW